MDKQCRLEWLAHEAGLYSEGKLPDYWDDQCLKYYAQLILTDVYDICIETQNSENTAQAVIERLMKHFDINCG